MKKKILAFLFSGLICMFSVDGKQIEHRPEWDQRFYFLHVRLTERHDNFPLCSKIFIFRASTMLVDRDSFKRAKIGDYWFYSLNMGTATIIKEDKTNGDVEKDSRLSPPVRDI